MQSPTIKYVDVLSVNACLLVIFHGLKQSGEYSLARINNLAVWKFGSFTVCQSGSLAALQFVVLMELKEAVLQL